MNSERLQISILGAGSWGTTVGVYLAQKGHSIKLWDAFGVSEKWQKLFLPGMTSVNSLSECISNSELIVVAVPSHAVRETAQKIAKENGPFTILSITKGIENKSLLRMSEVIEEELPDNHVCVLSGPSHAEEVRRNMPTLVVASSKEPALARNIQNIFTGESFRVYTNSDIIGVELGGALKNIIAIAAGISDGLGFGSNAKAALINRGIVEITRIGVSLGARAETFSGLSGAGDLVTTCISKYSRNRKFGELLAKGKTTKEAQDEIKEVVEGVRTTESAYELAKRKGVDAPITRQIYGVIFKGESALTVSQNLMQRKVKKEEEFFSKGGSYDKG